MEPPSYILYVFPCVVALILVSKIHSGLPLEKFLFIVTGLVASGVFGFYAFKIHGINESCGEWYKINQYIFNGLGALIGWAALYILIFYKIDFTDIATFIDSAGWKEFILVLISYYGITGYIPHVALLGKLPGR